MKNKVASLKYWTQIVSKTLDKDYLLEFSISTCQTILEASLIFYKLFFFYNLTQKISAQRNKCLLPLNKAKNNFKILNLYKIDIRKFEEESKIRLR